MAQAGAWTVILFQKVPKKPKAMFCGCGKREASLWLEEWEVTTTLEGSVALGVPVLQCICAWCRFVCALCSAAFQTVSVVCLSE